MTVVIVNRSSSQYFTIALEARTMLRSISLIAIIFIISCKKDDLIKCSGNCVPVTVSGKVIDVSNNKGLAGIPVSVYWMDAGICYVCPHLNVGMGLSNKSGEFHFNVSVENSRFGMYALYVEVPVPNGYIANMKDETSLWANMHYYNPSELQDLKFEMFQKTHLTMKLTRLNTDNFKWFEVSYRFDYTGYGIYDNNGNQPATSFDLTVSTAANVFTKVYWGKWYGVPGQWTYFTDSIKCIAGRNNSIVINY